MDSLKESDSIFLHSYCVCDGELELFEVCGNALMSFECTTSATCLKNTTVQVHFSFCHPFISSTVVFLTEDTKPYSDPVFILVICKSLVVCVLWSCSDRLAKQANSPSYVHSPEAPEISDFSF